MKSEQYLPSILSGVVLKQNKYFDVLNLEPRNVGPRATETIGNRSREFRLVAAPTT
ncbi:hypothetical protein [Rhizobium laguerreae]|uniref:hypothetical protein n=1 Tax=Rhizobium laguerreae TaxID=1076926 RepID=UPI001A8C85FC|nr:hypothetical protein [Rhizobium laguerreae]MBN9982295.1 hypothetical protein [Rhizobium laguerreae]MBY3069582.1 hypothetical protein [Rhizobium laguerreae]MBY3089815.1 hypothetical protein [Rhizobium laguerreae]MBY3247997.1 hypothetical protein [Rhizobium laguerreae]MBY3316231.1 hypothetical protein [Rhizobium laguerreae]